MKKFCILFLMLLLVLPANAFIVDETKNGEINSLVNKIGFSILNANKIPYRITFSVKQNSKYLIASSSPRNRKIVIYKNLLPQIDDEDELAAIIAHEISHGVDSNEGIFKGFFSFYEYLAAPKKYEIKADKRAVDYLVNAGYNPVAIIVVYSKLLPQPRYDWFMFHPLPSKRMMYIYEYIFNKYPAFLVNNKYKTNLYYQNFLLTSQQNRKKLQNKIQSDSQKILRYE